MEFEYDSAKAKRNLSKHGVSFEEAASVFGDPLAYTFADPDHSMEEERWLVFGFSHKERLLAVIFTYRRGNCRIISARQATRHEKKIYEES